jgi:hypothetical protein
MASNGVWIDFIPGLRSTYLNLERKMEMDDDGDDRGHFLHGQ